MGRKTIQQAMIVEYTCDTCHQIIPENPILLDTHFRSDWLDDAAFCGVPHFLTYLKNLRTEPPMEDILDINYYILRIEGEHMVDLVETLQAALKEKEKEQA